MSVLTITVEKSPIEIIDGIPQTLLVTTNIPSTIFYTLDGTDPNTSSDIVTGPIVMPTDASLVIFKTFATNGVVTSDLVELEFGPDRYWKTRRPHDKVLNHCPQTDACKNTAPFGTNSPPPTTVYGNTAEEPVDSPKKPGIPDGYDFTGKDFANYTDRPPDTYERIYSTTTSDGKIGPLIGNLPAKVHVRIAPEDPEYSEQNSLFFNPRAKVIFQDGTKPPEDPDVARQNRAYFSLIDSETYRDGIGFSTTGLEGSVPTGSFVKQHYNPRKGTAKFYYFDSKALRWIISEEPIAPNSVPTANLSYIVRSHRDKGVGQVFRWIPFKRHILS